MKKCIFCLFLLLMLPLLLLGCKKDPEPPASPDPNPASDFTYEITEEGVVLTGFTASSDGALVIPSEIEEKPVVKIAELAFSLRSFTSVYIPDSVTEIGASAFALNEQMTELRLPAALSVMGNAAFVGTAKLTSLSVPGTLSVIPDGAFQESGVTTLSLGEGVTKIGEGAFYATPVTAFVAPSSLREIAGYAFGDCPFLATVTLNEGLLSIGHRAFGGRGMMTMGLLTELTVPSTVQEFSEASVAYQKNLQRLRFEGNAPSAFLDVFTQDPGTYTIYYHSNATGFTFPRWNGYATRVIENENAPIPNYNGLEYESDGKGGIRIIGYSGEGGSVVIPNAISGKAVTEIGFRVFSGRKDITAVELSPSLERIGDMAFYNCTALKTVTYDDALEYIGKEAFCYCRALENAPLPESLLEIGERAFRYCTALKEITLHRYLTAMGKGAFEYSGLEVVNINELRVLGEFAFGCCEELRSVRVPGSIAKIPKEAFSGCEKLESLTLMEGISEIGEGAFQYTAITALDLPDSVRRIGEYAFESCYQLAEVSLGAQLAEVGDFAFNEDTLLEQIIIPAAVTNITEAAFSGCTGLKAVKFLGNAPALYENPREGTNYRGVNYIVYYRSTATGFTPEYWCNYLSELW